MFRTRRLFWVLGLTLLVATAAGAGWVLNHPAGDDGAAPDRGEPSAGPGVVCIGYVDVEPGVANLYPLQPGRVVEVAPENAHVKKGEVLLRLDDRLARARLKRALAALEDARKQLDEARLLPRQHQHTLEQLRRAVRVAQAEKRAAEQKLKLADRAAKMGVAKEEDRSAAEEVVRKTTELVEIAQEKVRAAEDARPQLKIDRAQADVDEKEAQVEEARWALDEYQIKAPADGEVLRVLTSVGTVLGSVPKGPAIQFCPSSPRIVRAEVLQEWAGRVKVGQEAVIEDDSTSGPRWTGRVKRLSDWFTNRRSIIQEPFQYNDVRTLECLVEVTGGGPQPLRIGQRVRVTVQKSGS